MRRTGPNKSINGGHTTDTGGIAMKNADKYGARVRSKTAGFRRGFGQCVIDIKNSLKSLFKARLGVEGSHLVLLNSIFGVGKGKEIWSDKKPGCC